MTADNWPDGLRLRPSINPEDAVVEVSDIIGGRRFTWSPDALARAVLAPRTEERLGGWLDRIASERTRSVSASGWQHWRERGWRPSDQYYVASRQARYADAGDDNASVRLKTLTDLIEQDGGPAAEFEHDHINEVGLPPSADVNDETLSSVLLRRRSGRTYVAKPVPAEILSGVLTHGLADVRTRRQTTDLANPLSLLDSFGVAWDVYLAVYAVDNVPPGVYKYDVRGHRLLGVHLGDHRLLVCNLLQGQRPPATAGWTLFLIADFPRYQWRYRHEHALRKLYLESGIVAQELVLVGTAYGLATLVTPAQRDQATLDLLHLPNTRFAPVTTLTTGWSRGRRGTFLTHDE